MNMNRSKKATAAVCVSLVLEVDVNNGLKEEM